MSHISPNSMPDAKSDSDVRWGTTRDVYSKTNNAPIANVDSSPD